MAGHWSRTTSHRRSSTMACDLVCSPTWEEFRTTSREEVPPPSSYSITMGHYQSGTYYVEWTTWPPELTEVHPTKTYYVSSSIVRPYIQIINLTDVSRAKFTFYKASGETVSYELDTMDYEQTSKQWIYDYEIEPHSKIVIEPLESGKQFTFYFEPTEYQKGLGDIIDFGEVEYDTDKVSKIFDDHYAVWHIVDPHDRFAKELQNTYDKAKDRLDLYYKSIKDFNPVSKTVMGVEYGQRRNRSDSFDYPVGGEDTSPTNTQDNIEDAKTDTTTVSRNDDPFGVLVKMGKMATFYDIFIDTFKDLFTEFEVMTW